MGYGLIAAVITTLSCISHLFITFYLSDSVKGIALAQSITSFTNWVLTTIVIYKYRNEFFSIKFSNLKIDIITDFFKICVPSSIIFVSDWFIYELCIFFSIFSSPIELKTCIIIFYFNKILFAFTNSLSQSCSKLVSLNMGEIKPMSCKSLSRYLIMLITIVSIINSTIIILGKGYIPLIYTIDQEVINLTLKSYNIVIIILIFDAFKISSISIINGLGYQKKAFIISLVVLYFIFIPLSLTLIYEVNTGIEGVWYSMLTCLICIASSVAVIIMCIDWDSIATRIMIHMRYKAEHLNVKEE
jgi:Na+-driven multidrug efflux pump